MVTKFANFLLLKARWTYSVFHWYNHVATLFVPSIGLEAVIAHIEAFTKLTQQALKVKACPSELLKYL